MDISDEIEKIRTIAKEGECLRIKIEVLEVIDEWAKGEGDDTIMELKKMILEIK